MIKTILLADDSLTIQKVVELTFADTQYHVVSLSSGDELLQKLPEVKPELVICDIIMPGRDGYDVCQEIKSNSDTLHIPVILLSGTFEPFDRDRALAAGCSEIVTKPFEAKRLVDAVDKLLSPAAEDPSSDSDGDHALDAQSTFGGSDGGRASDEPEFGTQLESPEVTADLSDTDSSAEELEPGTSDDGIDFTTSGFADMEAAGAAESDDQADSVEGIEFQSNNGFDEEPFSDPSDESFADAFADGPEPFSESAEFAAVDPSEGSSGPFTQETSERVSDLDDTRDDAPTSGEGVFDPMAETVEIPPQTDAFDVAGDDTGGFDVQSPEEAFQEPPAPIITDADTAPVPPVVEDSDAATGPQETDATELVASPLSDDDVDRIARRLLELATDRIEQVAWEVIPDVAEIAVRERIRQLEAEFETEN